MQNYFENKTSFLENLFFSLYFSKQSNEFFFSCFLEQKNKIEEDSMENALAELKLLFVSI